MAVNCSVGWLTEGLIASLALSARVAGPVSDTKISAEEVAKVAQLARLALTGPELEAAKGDLDAILTYVAELDALDVSAVEPTFHAIPMNAPLRQDVATGCASRTEVLSQAPATEAGGFAVPRVLEVD